MSKLMLLATMLAMVLVVTVPAMAQSLSVSASGDYDEQCTSAVQIGFEPEEFTNEQTFTLQYSELEDISAEGNTVTISPESSEECSQAVEQSSAISS